MNATETPKCWTACQCAYGLGFAIGLVSPVVTFLGAAAMGAGHGKPTGYYIGLTLGALAWSLFLTSFTLAVMVCRRDKSRFWFLLLAGLSVVAYPLLCYAAYVILFG
jgi:hypothetical protein